MDSNPREKKLPNKIDKHFFHPQHSLILLDRTSGMRCSTCSRGQDSASIYQCEDDCGFRICTKCNTMEPNITYPGHEHKLRFMEKMSQDLEQCDADDCLRKQMRLVTDELDRTAHSFMFRCVRCNFNIIHLVCGPMPRKIKYEYHIHPLVYAPFLVEDASGEYYCDICENERDAKIGFYYCKPCKYYAHPHCLLDEITSVLKRDDLKDEDLYMGGNISNMEGKKKVTLKDIINNLSTEDKETFQEHFISDSYDNEIGGSISTSSNITYYTKHQDGYIPREYFLPPSDKDFQRLVRSFDKYCNFRRMELESSELDVIFVEVNGIMVAWNLVDELKNLLEEHPGVVNDGSKITPAMKNLAFHFLCKVINGLGKTIFRDISEELLMAWYGYLKFVTRMGFRIAFLYAELEKLKHAFFDLRAHHLEYDIPNKLNKKKSELRQDIEKVEADLQKSRVAKDTYLQWKRANKSPSVSVEKLEWKTAKQVSKLAIYTHEPK